MPQFHHMTHYALDSTHLCHPKNLWFKFGLDWVKILESFNIFYLVDFFPSVTAGVFQSCAK